MTYIGLSPPNTFTKSTSQTFTGNGSTTAFTLQTRVSSPEDLEVFVSNVQQQPTESYTIGSDGVTMTFSEAPPSGTFYVIYRTVAQQAGTDTGASRLGENNTFTGTQTFNADVSFPDNVKAKFGTGNDLEIYHSGTASFISDTGTGNLRLTTNKLNVMNANNDSDMIKATEGGQVKLYNDGNEKLATIGAGIKITGSLDMNGGEVILDADGDTSITADTDDQIDFKVGGTDEMKLTTSGIVINEGGNDRDFRVEVNGKTHALFVDNSSASVCIGGDIADYAITGASDLVVGNANNEQNGITIVSGSALGNSTLNFSDSNSGDGRQAGQINYQHQYDEFQWYGENLNHLIRFTSAGNLVPTTGFIKQCNSGASGGTFHNGTNIGGYNAGNYNEMGHNVSDWILLLKSYSGTGNNYGMYIGHTNNTSNTTSKFLQFVNTAGTKFEVFGNGNVQNTNNSYGQLSDERLKSDITDAKSQWNDLKSIKVKNFKKHNTGDLVQIGVIAQELEKISPHLVEECNPSSEDIKHDASLGTLYTENDKENNDIPDGRIVGDVKEVKEKVKAVKYSILYMKAVKALQEAMERIETLEAKVKVLEEA